MTAPAAIDAQAIPATAFEAARDHWQAKIAVLGEQIAAKEAELARAEAKAAEAALEGAPPPTKSIAKLEADLRALKQARALAVERREEAEEDLAAARRAEAAEAAARIAAKMVREATALDDVLAELGQRMEQLIRLAREHFRMAQAADRFPRRTPHPVSPSALAGAIMHFAPEIFTALNCPRPSLSSRQPLATYFAAKFGIDVQQELPQ